jgi:hypothetical protein
MAALLKGPLDRRDDRTRQGRDRRNAGRLKAVSNLRSERKGKWVSGGVNERSKE